MPNDARIADQPVHIARRKTGEEERKVTRVSGPFVVEASIPTPVDWEGDWESDSGSGPMEAHGNFVDRMLEVRRRSPSIKTSANQSVSFEQVRPPAKVHQALKEADRKNFLVEARPDLRQGLTGYESRWTCRSGGGVSEWAAGEVDPTVT